MIRSAHDVMPVARANLAARVYAELEAALMEGRLSPGQRIKIKELAADLQVSETPVREAVVQLARSKAFKMEASRSITVAGLDLDQYLELRTIRAELEGLAAEHAADCIDDAGIASLQAIHEQAAAALRAHDGKLANKQNWAFHRGICIAAKMPELLAVVETIWLRNGPVQAFQFPNKDDAWPDWGRHLDIIEAFQRRDGKGARRALKRDLEENSAVLIKYLTEKEER